MRTNTCRTEPSETHLDASIQPAPDARGPGAGAGPSRAQVASQRPSEVRAEDEDLARAYRAHRAKVYRRALRLLGDPAEAEDAMQEVFIRALRTEGTVAERESPITWLYRITSNYCFNQVRNRRRRSELMRARCTDIDHGRPGADGFTLALLRQCMDSVDVAQARAAMHVHLEGRSMGEAADQLGVSRRTVGNLLDRLSDRLAD